MVNTVEVDDSMDEDYTFYKCESKIDNTYLYDNNISYATEYAYPGDYADDGFDWWTSYIFRGIATIKDKQGDAVALCVYYITDADVKNAICKMDEITGDDYKSIQRCLLSDKKLDKFTHTANEFPEDSAFVYVSKLEVNAEYRRKHIASKLLNRVFNDCYNAVASNIRVYLISGYYDTSEEDKKIADEFYKYHGFEYVPEKIADKNKVFAKTLTDSDISLIKE